MTEEKINLKDYFIHHYNDWGRLYCVEFNGDPLELENSIKRLEQENENLKTKLDVFAFTISQYESALEEINRVVKLAHKVEDYLLGQDYTDLVDRIEKEVNEVLNA